MEQAISLQDLREFRAEFDADRANLLAMNAVTSAGLNDAARQYSAVRGINHNYSVSLDQNGITWQKSSGRCWMYSGFNVLRDLVIRRLKLEEFRFSGNYLMFWDKLEKANLFLEQMIRYAALPLDSREISSAFSWSRTDGGEWSMFVSLVKKYGIVPDYAQPEVESSDNSRGMPPVVHEQLRQDARDLRAAFAAGADSDTLHAMKEDMLSVIYRMYCIAYGEPVKTFDLKLRGKEGEFTCERGLTPKEFYEKYVGVDLDAYVALTSGETAGAELKKYCRADELDVIEGNPCSYLAVPSDTLRSLAVTQLKAGEPIWFGCDVGERSWRAGGLLDADLYGYSDLLGIPLDMTRSERFNAAQAHMSHAMTLKGVDLDESGKPLTWRVENSWGPEPGKEGMFTMTDAWFEQYTYQVIINRRYIPEELLRVYDETEAVPLRNWEPYR